MYLKKKKIVKLAQSCFFCNFILQLHLRCDMLHVYLDSFNQMCECCKSWAHACVE